MQAVRVDPHIEAVDDVFDNFTERKGDDGQIIPAQAQNRNTDQKTGDSRQNAAGQNSRQKAQPRGRNHVGQADRRDDARKGADPHEARMAERKLAEHADGEIERNSHTDVGTDRDKLPIERVGHMAARTHGLNDQKGRGDQTVVEKAVERSSAEFS